MDDYKSFLNMQDADAMSGETQIEIINYNKMLLLVIAACLAILNGCSSISPQTENQDIMNPGEALVWFYREPLNHLTAVRRSHCPMYPSCSEYAQLVFRDEGFLKGWFMSFDRLMRCGRNELDTAPMIIVNGEVKAYDPPR